MSNQLDFFIIIIIVIVDIIVIFIEHIIVKQCSLVSSTVVKLLVADHLKHPEYAHHPHQSEDLACPANHQRVLRWTLTIML